MRFRRQPTPFICAQTSVAILADIPVAEAIELFGHDQATKAWETKRALDKLKIKHSKNYRAFKSKKLLPPVCIIGLVSPNTPGWYHLAVWNNKKIYDPFYGRNPKYDKDIYIDRYLEIK